MNTFYKMVDLIKTKLEEDPIINTVIFARLNEKDLYKKSIYPIAHIIPVSTPYINVQVNQITFDVGVFEQRDISKIQAEQKFEGNDNVIDNLNLTYSVLNDLLAYLELQNNPDNIQLVRVSNLQPIQYNDFNILDGWTVQITLEIPNNVEIC